MPVARHRQLSRRHPLDRSTPANRFRSRSTEFRSSAASRSKRCGAPRSRAGARKWCGPFRAVGEDPRMPPGRVRSRPRGREGVAGHGCSTLSKSDARTAGDARELAGGGASDCQAAARAIGLAGMVCAVSRVRLPARDGFGLARPRCGAAWACGRLVARRWVFAAPGWWARGRALPLGAPTGGAASGQAAPRGSAVAWRAGSLHGAGGLPGPGRGCRSLRSRETALRSGMWSQRTTVGRRSVASLGEALVCGRVGSGREASDRGRVATAGLLAPLCDRVVRGWTV